MIDFDKKCKKREPFFYFFVLLQSYLSDKTIKVKDYV